MMLLRDSMELHLYQRVGNICVRLAYRGQTMLTRQMLFKQVMIG